MRRIKSFWRHFKLTIHSLILSIEAVVIWSFTEKADIHFSKTDDVYLCCVVGGFFLIWSLMAGFVYGSVYEKNRKMVHSILANDEHTFMIYRDERLSVATHMFLVFISFGLIILVGGMDYKDYAVGSTLVFILTFCLSFYWLMITNLDNFSFSPWFLERVPVHWLTQSTDKFFRLKDQLKEEPEKVPPEPLGEPA